MFERTRALVSGFRTMRAMRGQGMGGPAMDPDAIQAAMRASEGMRAAVARGERPDTAAYMQTLADSGLVMSRCLPDGDPRLAPIDGLGFEAFVGLVAGEITDPDGTDTAVPGFDAWGRRVTADQELGVHYTAVLQEMLAARQDGG